jgi:hypothetical protein
MPWYPLPNYNGVALLLPVLVDRKVKPGLCTAGLPNADRAWLISSRIE